MVQTKYANFMSMITGPDVKSAYEKITHRSIISKHKLISDASQKYSEFPKKSVFYFTRRKKATRSP